MPPRSIRRAAERRQRKLLKKQNRLNATAARPDEAAFLSEPKTQANDPAERKARKLEKKQLRLPASNPTPPAPAPDPLESEFSPELIAEARAARERIERRLAARDSGAAAPVPPARTRDEINRANSLHSTGPVTPAGKMASSRNSLKHGLASGQLIIPGEDADAFESLVSSLETDFQPANSTEQVLVRQMAQSHWLKQRAIRLQNECFAPETVNEKRLALFLRYQTTHQRAFYKALHELTRLQKQRRQSTNGFVSQNAPAEQPHVDEPAHLSEAKTQNKAFVSQNTAHDPFAASPGSSNTTRNAAVTALNQNHPLSHQLYGR